MLARLCLVLCLALIAAPPAVAAAQNQNQGPDLPAAQAFVEGVVADGIALLSDAGADEAGRQRRFRALLDKNFAMKTIGRFALGRYWRQATPEQRAEYLSLFNDMVVEHYAKQFGGYAGQTMEITGARAQGERDAVVSSVIPREQGAPVDVDWRVRLNVRGGGYRIVDVVVEGVSMAMTHRSDFDAVIQRGGGSVEALLDALRNGGAHG